MSNYLTYPLTKAQERIWYTEKFYPNTSISNLGVMVTFKTKLNFEILNEAIQTFIRSNETVRLRLTEQDGSIPCQYISNYEFFNLPFYDYSEKSLKDLKYWLKRQMETSFTLYDRNLFDFAFFNLEKEKCGLFAKFHHSILDGVSVVNAINQIIDLYIKISNKHLMEAPYTNSYLEYIETERTYRNSKRYIKSEEFWKFEFNSLPEFKGIKSVDLYNSNTNAKRHSFVIPKNLQEKIYSFCKKHELSVFNIFSSLLYIYLYRVTNYKDLVLGTGFANRTTAIEKEMLGMFASTVPFRMDLNPDSDVLSFIRDVNKKQRNIVRHQKYPYNALISELRKTSKELSRLFDISIEYQVLNWEKKDDFEYVVEPLFSGHEMNEFSFHIKERLDTNELQIDIDYRTELFSSLEITNMFGHLHTLLEDMINSPDKQLFQLDICTRDEKEKILSHFNNPKVNYSINKTIHETFEIQVQKTPENVAVTFKDQKFTYKELNQRANQLAWELHKQGIKSGDIVGVIINRSIDIAISFLAILKVSGVYLPIDPQYPVERIRYILRDSNTSFILSNDQYISQNKKHLDFNGDWIDINSSNMYANPTKNLSCISKAIDLAYIIYTSGTTGNPKGVMVEHKGVVNLREYFIEDLDITENDKIGQFASISFDASIWEICMGLLTGASLHIFEKEVIDNYRSFEKTINEKNITILTLPPNYLAYLQPENVNSLRKIITAGSTTSPNLVKKWKSKMAYVNAYGPTEGTVCATTWEIPDVQQMNSISIGHPIKNMQAYIMSDHLQLQPIGVPGELCIAGIGLARGYINNAELTKEKFISHKLIDNNHMYRTGDLACWLPDGTIQYLGRIDDQVKIRGYRIEPSEIETVITGYSSIKDVAVVVQLDELEEKSLCAYIVANTKVNTLELKGYLSKKLPDYMIPQFFLQLDQMPVNSSGKIDKRLLSESNQIFRKSSKEYKAPTNNEERKLTEIWKEILGVKQLGVTDNFFELGGHSLKAMMLVTQIEKVFHVELSPGIIFERPTIKELSDYIESQQASDYKKIRKAPLREYYPLSSAQKRLYVINQIDPLSTSYNMPQAMEIKGNLDVKRLINVFQKLVQRHESFRTSFEVINEEPLQKIHAEIDFNVSYVEATEEQSNILSANFVQPFDLKKASLLRVKIIKIREDYHVLLLDMHHIISDGFSMKILFNEIVQLYQSSNLPELSVQYRDYAVWQNQQLETKKMQKQEEYWRTLFKEPLPTLDFPTDYPRPSVQNFTGSSYTFRLERINVEALKDLAAKSNTTVYMIMLAAYNVLLHKYTQQTDIIVGSPVAGRVDADLNEVVGMFVNTLPIRSYPSGNKTFLSFLNEVKQQLLESYNYQDYPLQSLVEKLDLERDLSRNPLFDTMFTLQNFGDVSIDVENLNFNSKELEHKTSRFDITVIGTEDRYGIKCDVEYSTKLFKRDTIQRLSKHFTEIIKKITVNPEMKLCDIDMLSGEERTQLLVDFNDTSKSYGRDKTLKDIFEEQVRKNPNNIAVVFEDKKLTYRELNERANQLAWSLRDYGVREDYMVGLLVERSLEMIVSIIAILKSGGAYVPIDPEYPMERIDYMLKDSGIKLLLTQSHLKESLLKENNFTRDIKCVDRQDFYNTNKNNLNTINSGSDLAYVIYTSGTTGKPKGNLTQHNNIIRVVKNTNYINITEEDSLLGISNYVFDGSTFDIFGALLNGAKLVLVTKSSALDVMYLSQLIQKENVTVFFTPTALFNVIVDTNLGCLENIRKVVMGGERASVNHVRKALEEIGENKIINGYGPTESTVFATTYLVNELKKGIKSIPIGKPICDTKVYITNNSMQLQPIGVVGELCVAGDGVSRGYLGQKELTQQKFINNPFEDSGKLYKTGDLARWLPDGNIEYIGRNDNQVKIRGHRIETSEIEIVLGSHSGVKRAIVTEHVDGNGNKALCAYYILKEVVPTAKLKEYLAELLPSYMVPAFFVEIDKVPLTINGKVNYRALPKPDKETVSEREYISPNTDLEKRLARIWEEVLGVKPVGLADSFFELGGDSIKAIQMAARLQKYDLEVEIKHLFQYPTIQELVNHIKFVTRKINQEPIIGESIITPIQQWFFEQEFTEQHYFNQSVTLFNKTGFDADLVYKVMKKLIEHHDALRMVFKTKGTILRQYNRGLDSDCFEFKLIEITKKTDIKETIQHESILLQKSMNLENGPLIKVGLFKTVEGDYLFLAMHHLIIDGVSWRILFEDFATAYSQLIKNQEIVLPMKTESYLEWAKQLKDYAHSTAMLEEVDYWKGMNEKKVKVLPKDNAITMDRMKDSNNINMFLSEEDTTNLLGKVHHAYNTEIRDILLTALGLAIKEWTGEEQSIIHLEGHGREEILRNVNINRTVGWFTSRFPLFIDLSTSEDALTYDKYLSYCIKNIKETLRNVPNKGVGYGVLKYLTNSELNILISSNINPEINFNYLGQFKTEKQSEVFEISSFDTVQAISPNLERQFAIDINGMIIENQLCLIFNYNKHQFNLTTIDNFADIFKRNLEDIIYHCINKNEKELTPTDVGNKELSIEELEDITSFFESISVES